MSFSLRFSGVGSWPEVGSRDAVRAVRDLTIGDVPDGIGIPYLPEQPTRGPGADMIGRAAGFLVGMAAQLEPSGWRLADARGRDMRRAAGYLTEDLDELAEAYDGYSGPLKVQVTGPWTLAGGLWLPRGERVVSDLGAVRDLSQSLTAGLLENVERVRRLVPGADVIVQFDEPGLIGVLSGSLKSASGMNRLRAVDRGHVQDILAASVAALQKADARVIVHSCVPDVPLQLLRRAGVDGVSIDLSLLREKSYDDLGELVDSGLDLWAGIIPTTNAARHPQSYVEGFQRLWAQIGFGAAQLARVVVTPACGLGHATPREAVAIQRLAREAAQELAEATS